MVSKQGKNTDQKSGYQPTITILNSKGLNSDKHGNKFKFVVGETGVEKLEVKNKPSKIKKSNILFKNLNLEKKSEQRQQKQDLASFEVGEEIDDQKE